MSNFKKLGRRVVASSTIPRFDNQMTQLQVQTPMRAYVHILEEHCKACELCVVACPSGNLKLSNRLNKSGFHPAEFQYAGTKGPCTGCGICYWVCPDFAVDEIRVRENKP